jgi:hypothetical protein
MGWSSNPTGYSGYTPLKKRQIGHFVDYLVVQRLLEPQGDIRAKI